MKEINMLLDEMEIILSNIKHIRHNFEKQLNQLK